MTYKTICVSLNDIVGNDAMFAAAAFLGRTFEAHIAGVYIVPAPQYYPGSGIDLMPVVFDGARKFFHEKAEGVRAAFESAMQNESVLFSFVAVQSDTWDIAAAFVAESASADLLLCKNVSEKSSSGLEADFVERIVVSTGRPVLIVPGAGVTSLRAGETIVGWNGSREAARAAFDALPLLKAADKVRVTVVDPQKIGHMRGKIPGADLAGNLARHGVNAVAESYPTNGQDPGEALLEHARDIGASLVVLGAYGHSRMREFILGGATNSVLAQMDRPVLMSH